MWQWLGFAQRELVEVGIVSARSGSPCGGRAGCSLRGRQGFVLLRFALPCVRAHVKQPL